MSDDQPSAAYDPHDDHRNDRTLYVTPARIIEQFGHLVPEIHLTLTSILQSIAIAFLLANTRAPNISNIRELADALFMNKFYMTQVTSVLFVIAAWNELTVATIIIHWPINSTTTALQFLLAISEIAAFSSANSVGLWLICMGFTFTIAFIIRRRNARILSPRLVPLTALFQSRTYGRFAAWYFAFLAALGMGLGWLRTVDPGRVGLPLAVDTIHVVPFDIVVPAIFAVSCILIMRNDDLSYSRIFSKVLEDTPYVLRRMILDVRESR